MVLLLNVSLRSEKKEMMVLLVNTRAGLLLNYNATFVFSAGKFVCKILHHCVWQNELNPSKHRVESVCFQMLDSPNLFSSETQSPTPIPATVRSGTFSRGWKITRLY